MNSNLKERLKKVRLLATDVDGVLTDGAFYIDSQGGEFKKFHALDGAGFALLKAAGFPVVMISGRNSAVTSFRARELGIEQNLYQGNLAKIKPYAVVKEKYQLQDDEIAYVGDDLADIPLLEIVGVPIAVANASDEVKRKVLYVTTRAGGEGAFREIVELILKAQDKFEQALSKVTKITHRNR